MSLNVGTLHGGLTLDTRQWTRNLTDAFKSGDRMVTQAQTTYSKGGQAAGEGFATGVSRKIAGLTATMGQEGDRAGGGFASSVARSIAGLADKFRSEGADAGDGFGEGVRSKLDPPGWWRDVNGRLHDETNKFAAAGKESGEGFSDSAEKGAGPIGTKLSGLLSNAGEKMRNVAAGIGAAIAASLVAALIDRMDFEKAVAKMTAQLGVGGARAKEIGKIAGKVYADGFGESIDDVTGTIATLFQNGIIPTFAADKDIETLTRKFMTLSDVMDQDIGMTAQAVGQMVRTGLAGNATDAMDILTRAIQAGGDKADDLTATMQEYSTQFRKLGLSGADAVGLMIQGLQGGARDADTVADAIKEFGIRAQEALTTTEGAATPLGQALQQLGIDGQDFQRKIAAGGDQAKSALDDVLDRLRSTSDPIRRAQIGVALFGTKWEDLQDAILKLDPSAAEQALGPWKKSLDDLGSAYDTHTSKLETAKRAWSAKIGEWVESAAGLFSPGRFFGPEKWDAGIQWFEDRFDAAGQWVERTVGGVVTSVSNMADWVSRAFTNVGRWISQTWSNAWNTVRNTADGAVSWVAGIPGRIGAALGNLWAPLTAGFAYSVEWVKGRAWDMVAWFGGLPARIGSVVGDMWAGIRESFRAVLNTIIRWWNDLELEAPSINMFGTRVGGWKLQTPNLPLFHQGTGAQGVPGPPGREVVAKLLAGETVRTVPQERALQRNLAGLAAMASATAAIATAGQTSGPSGAGSYTTTVVVPVAFHGPVAKDAERWVRDTIASGARKGIITARDLPGGRR